MVRACGSREESSGASGEYLFHMEIPHCSFKIPFPSFKSDSGFLQLIHGYCQMNLGRFGARVGLNAVNAWGFFGTQRERAEQRSFCFILCLHSALCAMPYP